MNKNDFENFKKLFDKLQNNEILDETDTQPNDLLQELKNMSAEEMADILNSGGKRTAKASGNNLIISMP